VVEDEGTSHRQVLVLVLVLGEVVVVVVVVVVPTQPRPPPCRLALHGVQKAPLVTTMTMATPTSTTVIFQNRRGVQADQMNRRNRRRTSVSSALVHVNTPPLDVSAAQLHLDPLIFLLILLPSSVHAWCRGEIYRRRN
jgi:hypothetical protein